MKILHIDSAITGDASVSRQISAAIVAQLRQKHKDAVVSYRDLEKNPVSQLTGAGLGARMAGEPDQALEDFLTADIVVIGAPMYNFSVPAQLKAWIDSVLVAGKTFSYTAEGPKGLAGDKQVIIASARGGFYSPGSPMAAVDHQESYLKSIFAFIGIKDIEIVRAEGLAMGPEKRQASIAGALAMAAAL